MEKLVVILDNVPEYATQLARYLNQKREFPYRAVVYSGPEEIESHVENGAVYAILAAECYEKAVIGFAAKENIRVYWFGDTQNVSKASVLYRYQSAEEIMKHLTERKTVCKKLKLSGVYCPSGGSFVEGLSEMIARGYAEKEKVLFLPMLPFAIFGREWGDGLSELMFYLRRESGIRKEFFETLVQREGNFHRIGPARWGSDLRGITEEDMKKLFSFLEEQTEYGHTVIAVGQLDSAGSKVLRCCDRILIPVPATEDARGLQTEFMRQQKEAGETEFLSRMIEFPLRKDESRDALLQAAAAAIQKGGEMVAGAERRDSFSNS